MSKERARRRAERQATAAQASAAAARRERDRVAARRRRQARRAAVRRLLPRLPRGGYSRRTREQRVGILMVIITIATLTFLLFDSWTIRVAVVLVTLLATPVVTTAAFGRSNR